jgi:hypothetical protein
MTDDPLAAMRRFARPSADAKREADPFLCRHLRSRTWLGADAPGPGDAGKAALYSCLRTMRATGPDGDPATPEACTDERICFEAAVGPGGES